MLYLVSDSYSCVHEGVAELKQMALFVARAGKVQLLMFGVVQQKKNHRLAMMHTYTFYTAIFCEK